MAAVTLFGRAARPWPAPVRAGADAQVSRATTADPENRGKTP
jgi:hypothetical protein